MGASRIDGINIVVGDVDGAAQFLSVLGVELPPAPPGWESHHRSVASATSSQRDTSDATFGIDLDSSAFAHEWGGLDPSYTGLVVNVRVDEPPAVDRLHQLACSAGGRSLKAPYDAFWGSRFALVEGPGPLMVGIMSLPDDARRAAPPDLPNAD